MTRPLITGDKPWCAVIGDPVEHSRSPLLHQAAYRKLGLDWDYFRWQIPRGEFATEFAKLPANCRGLSVTMPHKQAVATSVDFVDGLAKLTGAANTIVFSPAGSAAFNTDVFGIAQALRSHGVAVRGMPVTILGGRATASSAIAALTELRAGRITVAARTLYGPGTATAAAHRMGVEIDTAEFSNEVALSRALSAPIVVSTLPGGVIDSLAGLFRPEASHTLFDIAYSEAPGSVAEAYRSAGATIIPGLDMLVYQAQMQVKLMTGHEVEAGILFDSLD